MAPTNTIYSYSRLSRWVQCPLSYKLHYHDKAPSEPGAALRFGLVPHAALERTYKHIVASELKGAFPTDHLLGAFADAWTESGLTDYVAFDEGHKMLKAYAAANTPVDYQSIVAVEHEFRVSVDGIEIVGYIDRVDRVDAETVEIVDYKTNRLIFTREEVNQSLQLSIYTLAAKQLWPWARTIRLSFDLLRHGVRMETTRSDEDLEAAQAYIATLVRQIETASDFPARLNTNCIYCDHKTQCTAYASALRGEVKAQGATPDDMEAVGREREQLAHTVKILDARKRELEQIIKTHLRGQEELVVGGVRYAIYNAQKVSYPLAPTLRVLTEGTGMTRDELVAMLATVDKDAMEALLKQLSGELGRPRLSMLKAELDAVAEKSPMPRLWAKEVRA